MPTHITGNTTFSFYTLYCYLTTLKRTVDRLLSNNDRTLDDILFQRQYIIIIKF
jgi:hypothetical protein